MTSNTTNTSTAVQCESCYFFEVMDFRCRAYPLGIPADILTNTRRHDKIQDDQINVGEDPLLDGPAVVYTTEAQAKERKLEPMHRYVMEHDIEAAEQLRDETPAQ